MGSLTSPHPHVPHNSTIFYLPINSMYLWFCIPVSLKKMSVILFKTPRNCKSTWSSSNVYNPDSSIYILQKSDSVRDRCLSFPYLHPSVMTYRGYHFIPGRSCQSRDYTIMGFNTHSFIAPSWIPHFEHLQ